MKYIAEICLCNIYFFDYTICINLGGKNSQFSTYKVNMPKVKLLYDLHYMNFFKWLNVI